MKPGIEDIARAAQARITGVLEYILYTKDLRAAIADLKAKNDFRKEGMRLYNRRAIFIYCFIGVLFILLFVDPPVRSKRDFLTNTPFILQALFLTGMIVFFVCLKILVPREILAYTFGEIAAGIVRHSYSRPGGLGQINFAYQFTDGHGVEHTNTVSRISKMFMLKKDYPEKGKPIRIFYLPRHPTINYPFIHYFFDMNCISKSQYDKITQLIRIEEYGRR